MKKNNAGWESSLNPLLEISEINRHAIERLAELQTGYLTTLFESNLKQFQAMVDSGDPQVVSEMQFRYYKELESKLQQTAEEELETLKEARHAIDTIMDQSYEHHRHFLNEVYPNPNRV